MSIKRGEMKFVRIFARLLEDSEQYLILLCQIDDSNRINQKMEALGYVNDWDDEQDIYAKYPFMLTFDDETCEIDYGYGEHPEESTNIHKKHLEEGEKFTRFYSNEQYLYNIEKITELPFNSNKYKH